MKRWINAAESKGPLLEGEERVLACVAECPQGFSCEHSLQVGRVGICCPNLNELYRLYSIQDNDEEAESSENSTLRNHNDDGGREKLDDDKKEEGKNVIVVAKV